jgi:hypothetical protein
MTRQAKAGAILAVLLAVRVRRYWPRVPGR